MHAVPHDDHHDHHNNHPPAAAVPGRWHPASLFGALTIAMNAAGALGIVLLMVLINADVLGRAAFSAPIRGVPEVVSLSIVSIVFLQAGYMLRSGRMIASDSLIERLRQRAPAVARALDVVFAALGCTLFGVLFHASLPSFVDAWSNDLFVGAEGDFTVPIWPMKLIVLAGSAMLAAQYALFAWAALRRGASPLSREERGDE